ncbi:pyridoxamine 5'-phosphate oxidase [Glaciecola sp. MH2013]|uniref:pyridoxamine 5'-phosphate oxidase n=1 Tax=Glaciecola sp. MH2013 TaxID=2785524 RepID=UPI00189E5EC2|nr:pyridoxamine 5'-phosphate oxidase [Glaciecola sp. MH2013]MBF7072905.1 pyridoxamine 5'-phosphate oxidase [Glaciecola sp. MH2013]
MNQQIFPSWRQRLVRSLHVNRSQAQSKYYQVASCSVSGKPSNRTMVFRGFANGTDNLLSVTDKRSKKISDWTNDRFSNKQYEICWYFAKTREQYRIAGELTLVDKSVTEVEYQKLLEQSWANLSENAQSSFFAEAPGTPFAETKPSQDNQRNDVRTASIDSKTDKNISEKTERFISDNFVLVIFRPYEVDYLNLRETPHLRVSSALSDNWEETRIFS